MEEQPALPLDDIDAVVASHNIAGGKGVLNAAGDDLERRLQAHYAARGVDHIPYIPEVAVRSYVLTPDPANLIDHLRYREALSGMTFSPIADMQELVGQGIRKALFLPYIRLVDDPFPEEIEWLRYGLPPGMTIRLKDKAYMHRWLTANGFAAHTPNFVSCDATYIPRFGLRMLHHITDMYDELDMRGRYPLGLMIRGALSDGNYAMAAVQEVLHNTTFNGYEVQAGAWILKPNGKTDDLEVFETAENALQRVRDHIRHENDPDIDDRVVMTRLLDVDVSPGMSAAITGGAIHQFPFNGQYMAAGDTACTGTWTFAAAVGDSTAAAISRDYLAQAQELLRGILARFFSDYDTTNLYAMLNMDIMVVGALERELWRRAAQINPVYCQSAGCFDATYRPRAYDPSLCLFAEINPRDTNWTIAMKAVLQALHLPCTIQNLSMLAAGKQVQVLARDHWRLPEGMSISQARANLMTFHRQIAASGEGFIMRMSDNPAGVITYTHSSDAQRVSQITDAAYEFLLEHSLVFA